MHIAICVTHDQDDPSGRATSIRSIRIRRGNIDVKRLTVRFHRERFRAFDARGGQRYVPPPPMTPSTAVERVCLAVYEIIFDLGATWLQIGLLLDC